MAPLQFLLYSKTFFPFIGASASATLSRTIVLNTLSQKESLIMLEQIRVIQSSMDDLDRESKKRESNMEQLEKCRIKYQELTKNKLTKP